MIEDIQFKRMIEPGRKPTPAQVAEGSFVINLADRQIYTKDHNGEIISVGGGAGGGVPVGTVLAFTKLPLAKGYLPCDGSEFDPILYPELYRHLGVNTTPNMTDKYLKGIGEGISPLTTVPWMIPEHSHNVSASGTTGGQTLNKRFYSSSDSHNHTFSRPRGDKDYSNGGSNGTWWGPSANVKVTTSTDTHNHYTDVNFGTHTHSFSFSTTSAGIKEALNKGNKLDVDHVTVVFGIQATPQVDDPLKLNADKVVEDMRTIQSEFEDYKTRASLPVGAIVLFPKLPVPADFLPCDGRKFDKTLFADLYNYLGTDTTPVYTAKYVKMISDTLSPLQTVPWQIPDHSHSVDVSHTHTATFRGNPLPNHYHQTGNPWSNLHSYNVSRFGKDVTGNGSVATETQNSLPRSYPRTENKSAGTPSGSVSVTNFSGNKVSSGIREAINKGQSLEVNHIGGIYAIKCTGRIDDAQQIAAKNVIATVNDLTTSIVNPNILINGGMQLWQRALNFPSPEFGTYTADRWIAAGNGCKQEVRYWKDGPDRWLAVIGGSNQLDGWSLIAQRVESSQARLLIGKELTLSFDMFGSEGATYNKAVAFIDYASKDNNFWELVNGQTFEQPFVCGERKRLVFNLGVVTEEALNGLQIKLGASAPGKQESEKNLLITNVKLEVGRIATPFIAGGFDDNYQQCLRYFQKIDIGVNTYKGTLYGSAGQSAGNVYGELMALPQIMREWPTTKYIKTNGESNNYWVVVGITPLTTNNANGLTVECDGKHWRLLQTPATAFKPFRDPFNATPNTVEMNQQGIWEPSFQIQLDAEI